MDEIKVLRKDLYNEVWSQPMRKLAKKYNLSDVGLAKVCRKHSIPVPGLGYWRKLETGHKVVKGLLFATNGPDIITIHAKPKPPTPVTPIPIKPISEVPLSTSLANPHPVVKEAMTYYRSAKEEWEKGHRLSGTKDCIHLHVTKGLLHRALLIADSLFKELARRNCIDLDAYAHGAFISGEKVSFVIEEPYKIIKKKNPKGSYSEYSEEYPASGLLRLVIYLQKRWSRERSCTWCDGKKRKLEDMLGEIVNKIESVGEEEARRVCERKIQEAEEQKIKEIRRRQYESALYEYEKEKAKVDKLLHETRSWMRSNEIRGYLKSLREAYGVIEPGSEFEEWLKWAYNQADRFDPTKKDTVPSILDKPKPEPRDYNLW